ncbi:hypothetical protein VNO78_27436 [Psophocarpus tetragonolobus]|uniref:Uncharacterized protein n=1 Tax=Psophocarpus tetragonolobus TaxID=3891 RepID=A0AAN9XAK4_PSOTE
MGFLWLGMRLSPSANELAAVAIYRAEQLEYRCQQALVQGIGDVANILITLSKLSLQTAQHVLYLKRGDFSANLSGNFQGGPLHSKALGWLLDVTINKYKARRH